ncbi:MAG: hypothetical protein LBQ40_06560, partial [Clostridiales bacterium]|nr:hypothetical protein [Clostridiales bacterium]
MLHKTHYTKNNSKTLLVAAAFIFMLAAFSLGAVVGRTNSAASAELGGGDGLTEDTAIEISSAEQLKTFADNVNDGNSYEGQYIKLTANIDLSQYDEDFDEGKGWTPIGGYDHNYRFSGNFDGSGYTISNLYINTGHTYAGLFGYVSNASIKNLGITSGSIVGNNLVGGIAGYFLGGIMQNCYNFADIESTGARACGIAAYNTGTIENCYNAGNVTGTHDSTGGIVASNRGTIRNCYNTGVINAVNVNYWTEAVGGIAGYSEGLIENCYNVGELYGGTARGGIVGAIGSASAKINNCYNNYDVAAVNLAGNTSFHQPEITTSANLTTDEMLSGALIAGLAANDDGEGEWIERPGKNGVYYYPELKVFAESLNPTVQAASKSASALPYLADGGDNGESESNPIEIWTAENLKQLADNVNDGNSYEGKYIKLMANIDLSQYGADFDEGKGWTPIGSPANPFLGCFDGGGYTVSNLYINREEATNLGLFGQIGSAGKVKNLGLTDCSVGGDYSTSVGGIAGWNSGSIENCYRTGGLVGLSDSAIG